MLREAAQGGDVEYLVDVRHEQSRPRLFDGLTHFQGVSEDGWYGCYVIYSPKHMVSEESAIAYIGKGWVGARGESHWRTKPGLRRMASQIELKYVALSWSGLDDMDSDAAWLLEQILLKEHESMFGRLPKHNKQGATSEVNAWRRVLRWSPGPVSLLKRYGAG